MPKRTHRQIRLDTFAALEKNGTPRLGRPPKVDENTVVAKREIVKKKRVPVKICCVDKYGDNLPQRFRRCPDCFKEPEMQQPT